MSSMSPAIRNICRNYVAIDSILNIEGMSEEAKQLIQNLKPKAANCII